MTTQGADPQALMAGLADRLGAALVGHAGLIERLLIGLLAGGHLLIEGPPGIAKTRAVKELAAAIDGGFARIQCTPDLLPSDLTGTPVLRPETGRFEFMKGPVFHNIVLADEINRAPPKVQSALLEAMAEAQVTSGPETHRLPRPFFVIATQNPIEHEGTFPLPEAQLDRFLLHVSLGLPDAETERQILDLVEREGSTPSRGGPVLDTGQVLRAAEAAMAVHLAPPLRDYIVRLVMATRTAPFRDWIDYPVSPRGSLALASAAKARAWLAGRDHALPEDVAVVASDALAHRMVLTWSAVADGRTARGLIDEILAAVPAL